MFKIKEQKKFFAEKNFGFTLIEAMTLLFIFSVVALTFYSVWTLGINHIQDSKNRLGAASLARGKMEIVRNLAYENIGTTGGIPSGNLLQSESVAISGRNYMVNTLVQYVDDPFDGNFPSDTIPNDYKRVKVTVSWGTAESNAVSLVSIFPPPGLEVSAGDGVLAVNILHGSGSGVPQANVRIVNTDVSPAVDVNVQTDNNGNLLFPGAAESILGYTLTVSKNGYESVATIHPNEVLYNYTDIHASVVAGSLNPKTIYIDRTVNLKIKSIDGAGNNLNNVSFRLRGGRILGIDASQVPAVNVYNIDENSSTGSSGEREYNRASPGQFTLSSIGNPAGYNLVDVDPDYIFTANPGEETTATIKFAANEFNSFLVAVFKNSDGNPIAGANVRLTSAAGYDKTLMTKSDGKAFFPDGTTALEPGEYNLQIDASGYNSYSGFVTISRYTGQSIGLNAT